MKASTKRAREVLDLIQRSPRDFTEKLLVNPDGTASIPHPGQKELLEGIRRITVAACERQWGKSTVLENKAQLRYTAVFEYFFNQVSQWIRNCQVCIACATVETVVYFQMEECLCLENLSRSKQLVRRSKLIRFTNH